MGSAPDRASRPRILGAGDSPRLGPIAQGATVCGIGTLATYWFIERTNAIFKTAK